ncbi:MAG: SMP-30/gluconolactonase/LRE family protein [Mariniphaga sp.]|nr:SMP-30/gluconolactonase/LRE family protein [Mariniphaga sp.]
MNSEIELVLDTKSALGEGAIWNHKTQKLYWINITGKTLNIYNPAVEINKELMTGQIIGTVVPSESGNVIVALQNGIYYLDVETGTKNFIVDPESDFQENRFNDGKCDPFGRLWVGTMKIDATGNNGALYKIDAKGFATKMIDKVSISNGIVWSNDHTKMFYIDTPTQKVMRYDFNNKTGEISNGKVAIEIPKDTGSPDGMTIDEDGNLWIALWGGYAVGCWNPETGELIHKIKVPAKNVTSVAFGDSDLMTLYITTARQGMTDEELKQYPFSGGVFKIRTGTKGVPANFFKGDF